jgi:hypothetical protein
VQGDDGTTTKSCTGGSTTTLGRRAVLAADVPTETASPDPESNNHLEARAPCDNAVVDDYIVYPKDPDNVSNFVNYLKDTLSRADERVTLWSKTTQVQGGAFTAFFYINELSNIEADRFRTSRDYLGIAHYYAIVDNNQANNYPGTGGRDEAFSPDRGPWELSQMSVPPGGDWVDYWDRGTNPQQFHYDADDALGTGQIIYLVEDDINKDQSVSARSRLGRRVLVPG